MLLTLRSSTLLMEASGVVSRGPPHVAPALATKMCTSQVMASISFASRWTSENLDRSQAIVETLPRQPGTVEWSAPSADNKPCGPSSFLATRITRSAPACRNAVAVWRPMPREPGKYLSTHYFLRNEKASLPPVMTATLLSRRNKPPKSFSRDMSKGGRDDTRL